MSDKIRDYLSIYHDYGMYYPSRSIDIFGDIDQEKSQNIIRNLTVLDLSPGTIEIKLMSEGGCVVSGLAIYNAIKSCTNNVRIMCYGEVSSMATIILQAADERVMKPDSFLMLHVGSEQSGDMHPRAKEQWDKFMKALEVRMEDIYLAKIKEKKKKFTRKQLQEMILFDRIFTPKEACEHGLIDSIDNSGE